MRKTSQDGGDSTSITSGIENEIKKSGPGILKSTKNSIKRKVQNFSNESDDTANEPLLHKNKEKTEIEKQSAKFLIAKTKTEFASEKGNDKDKLLADEKITKPSITVVTGITDMPNGNGLKDQKHVTSQAISSASIHNHMNTNVFNNPDGPKNTTIAKTQILVELDTSKSTRYSPSPLIFTTAKIHTDGKIQQMEPVQVTPVPILSTIEGGLVKTGTKAKEFESQPSKEKKDFRVISPIARVATISKLPEKRDVSITSNESFAATSSIKPLPFVNKVLTNDNKDKVSAPTQNGSETINSKIAAAQVSNSKIMAEDSLKTKSPRPLIKENIGAKLVESPINNQDLQHASYSKDYSSSEKKDFTKTTITQARSVVDKSYVDINKNFQSLPKLDSVAKIEDKKGDYKATLSQPTSNGSSTKGFSSCSSAKEVKTAMSSIDPKESKIGNSHESKITTSKIKSPAKEKAKDIVTAESIAKPATETLSGTLKVSTVKPLEISFYAPDSTVTAKSMTNTTKSNIINPPVKESPANTVKTVDTIKSSTHETLSNNKVNTVKSPENNISKTDSSLPKTLMSSTSKSNVIKSPDKENVVRTVSSTNPVETISSNKMNTIKSPENSKTAASVLPITTKNSAQDKGFLISTSKTTGKETTTQVKPASDLKSGSNVSNACVGTASSTKPTVANIENVPTQTTSSGKTTPTVSKVSSTTNTAKTSTSTPATSLTKTVSSGQTSTGIANSKVSFSISSKVSTVADNTDSKYKSNNIATIVSSISKPSMVSNTKLTSSRTSSSTSAINSPSTVKQSTSPSTVKTISSIPTVKSAIVSTVPHENKSTKGVSTSINESMSSVSNTTNLTTKKPLGAKDTSTVTVAPSAKVVATSSTKPAVKSSTQSEDVKDSKGSKA